MKLSLLDDVFDGVEQVLWALGPDSQDSLARSILLVEIMFFVAYFAGTVARRRQLRENPAR
ncbi:hypothetical protein [Pseudofrankia asymbiotica]|uniref:hypothetical protein n=1 Tax=Pseudofrankia asymbiotica TaxID=1834516 RepID=UPI0013043C3C|nr:hypothetical protein [Pseudofrankia asymbiotica]